MMLYKLTKALIAMAIVSAVSTAGAGQLQLRVEERSSSSNTPVCAKVTLPDELGNANPEHIRVTMQRKGSEETCPGQIVPGARDASELWWIAPETKAGETSLWTATLEAGNPPKDVKTFRFRDAPGKHMDILFGDRPVSRYMYEFDDSTTQSRHETYKPYHHVYGADGKDFITKGPYGLYTHHRGIFIGWNRIKYKDKRYDLWHMTGGNIVHQKFLERTSGPVLARMRALIHWINNQGETMVVEERQATFFRQPANTMMLGQFDIDLRAVGADVELNGDPEHAGFQYRPSNYVADAPKEDKARYLFHEPGINAHKYENPPWVGMCYGMPEDKSYVVEHMDRPSNPRPTLYSAYRDYGRFGAFFVRTIPEGESLDLQYRILVREGTIPEEGAAREEVREQMAARDAAFVKPPEVSIVE